LNEGYAVGDYGLILKTSNGGTSWESITSGISKTFSSVCFSDSNKGFIFGESGTILTSVNGGLNWTSIGSDSCTKYFLNSSFPNQLTGYAVGDSGFIMKTTNSGSTWIEQSSGTLSPLHGIYFIDENNGFVVGENGTILKTENGGSLGIQNNDFASKVFTAFPNPVHDNLIIEVSNLTENTQLLVFSPEGREVLKRKLNNHKTQIDLCDFATGVYIIKIENEKICEAKKIIKN